MTDTPYGVSGCLCYQWEQGIWNPNPHCPYHGILPRNRTDTGTYRVVPRSSVDHQLDDAYETLKARNAAALGRHDDARDCPTWGPVAVPGLDSYECRCLDRDCRECFPHPCGHDKCTGPGSDHHTLVAGRIRCGCSRRQSGLGSAFWPEELAEVFADGLSPAYTFNEESWWTRLRIRLRWAKEALFDDVG